MWELKRCEIWTLANKNRLPSDLKNLSLIKTPKKGKNQEKKVR